MHCQRASDHSLLITCGDRIHPAVHERVLRLARGLCVPGVLNVHPAYASVLVSFDPLATTHGDLEHLAEAIELEPEDPTPARVIEVPVCYGGELGPDLEDVADWCGFDTGKVIALHSSAEYLVYFLGFSPGFPYLGGLPPALAMPRLPEPRRSVAAGSVAIGGEQAGIYPVATPGGWRIIGRTPLRLFDPGDEEQPTLLEPGDCVRFRPIERNEFERISRG